MKNLLLLPTLFVFLLSISSQSGDNYNLYYKKVNQAELNIVNHEFDKALNIYISCFNDFTNHDSKDVYNASICAIKSKNFNLAQKYIQELLSLGFKIDQFKNNILDSLPQIYRNEINSKFDSLNLVYYTKFDYPLKNKLDSMDLEEQYYIRKRSTNSYDSLVLEHAKILKRILIEKGIPKVGMFPGGMKIPIALLRHHFGVMHQYKYSSKYKLKEKNLDFSPYDLQPILLQAILNGEFSPLTYINCVEYNEFDKNKDFGKITINIDLEKKEVKITYPSKAELLVINENRKEACLESFEDASLKCPEVKCFLDNYPFNEHIALCKKLNISKANDKNTTFETRGEFVSKSCEIQNRVKLNTGLAEFILPKTNSAFSVQIPEK